MNNSRNMRNFRFKAAPPRGKLSEVRRYGFYRCTTCKKTWESAYAYCRKGSNKPLYTQKCKMCDVAVLPYETEPMKTMKPMNCPQCGEIASECDCEHTERHVDPNKPHRADLCQRCISGKKCHRF